jgi:hypothetical protein
MLFWHTYINVKIPQDDVAMTFAYVYSKCLTFIELVRRCTKIPKYGFLVDYITTRQVLVFSMCCDFKRMLARDSWLHSITFQTLNNQDLVTGVWLSASIQTFQSLLLLETCTLLASKQCWSHQIKFPFRHVNQLSLSSCWFCW